MEINSLGVLASPIQTKKQEHTSLSPLWLTEPQRTNQCQPADRLSHEKHNPWARAQNFPFLLQKGREGKRAVSHRGPLVIEKSHWSSQGHGRNIFCDMFHCILFFPTSHISGRTEGSTAAISLQSDSISICCTYTDHLPQGETTEWWSWWILLSQLQGGAWGLSDSWSEINASGRGGKRISFPECLALNADEQFCPYSAKVAFLQHIQWWDQAISGRSKFSIFTLQAY